MKSVVAYTDGSADNRKGHKDGGWGAVIMCDGVTVERKGGKYLNTTSARMEIIALLQVMKLMKEPVKLTVYIDNQYVVNTIEKGWLARWIYQDILQEKANSDLWKQVLEEYNRLGGYENIRLIWVKGHNGNQYNEKADRLAFEGRSQTQTIIDRKV